MPKWIFQKIRGDQQGESIHEVVSQYHPIENNLMHMMSSDISKICMFICCNYLSHWCVEFKFELIWLFTNRFRGLFAEINQILVSSSTLSKNWVVNNFKSTRTRTQLDIVTDDCSSRVFAKRKRTMTASHAADRP